MECDLGLSTTIFEEHWSSCSKGVSLLLLSLLVLTSMTTTMMMMMMMMMVVVVGLFCTDAVVVYFVEEGIL